MSDLDFSPPRELNVSLWRSLILNLADRFSPERLPPLELSSKPVDLGMLEGDRLAMPWYRTVFINIADVVSPESLPALELESRPVDVGELLGDDLSHGWWHSLLAGLRDRLSPERPAPLNLTATPITGFGAESTLQILDWSDLIDTPKVFLPDGPVIAAPLLAVETVESLPEQAPRTDPTLLAARMQLVRDIGRTRFRRRIWIAVATAEAGFLLFALFKMV
jgi:hypothetical protein